MSHKILVVDDDPVIRMLVSDYLSAFGHAVDTADCGSLCLEKLEGELPDCLILDLQMPGMNGFEVLKSIRENPRTKGLRVLLLSANSETSKLAEDSPFQPNQYLNKPFEIKELLKAISADEK